MRTDIIILFFGLFAVVLANTIEKGAVIPYHSLQAPFLFGRTTSIENWEYGGSAVATESFIRLTPAIRGRTGWIWNTKPVTTKSWEVTVEFKVHNTRSPGADGMAFWYLRDPQKPGTVFGNADEFVGLGVIFDTYDNDGKRDSPKILASVNDGTQKWDHQTDGEPNKIASCLASIRNRPHSTKARIAYEDKTLQVFIDAENRGEFTQCFVAHNIDLPTGYYFGMSAGTGGLADYHDVYSIVARNMDSNTPPPAQPDFQRYSRSRRNLRSPDSPQQQQAPPAAAVDQSNAAAAQTQATNDADSQQFLENFRNRMNTGANNNDNVAVPLQQEQQQPQVPNPADIPPPTTATIISQPPPPPQLQAAAVAVASIDPQTLQKVENIVNSLSMLAPLIANTASRSDLRNVEATITDTMTRAESMQTINQLRDDVTRNLNSVSEQQKSDMDKILSQIASLGEKYRLLEETINALNAQQGTYTRVINRQVEEVTNTIKKETSWGFWTYFIVLQVLGLVGYIFYTKYRFEKSSKLF